MNQPFEQWVRSAYSTRHVLREAVAILRDHTPIHARVVPLALQALDSFTFAATIDLREMSWWSATGSEATPIYRGPPPGNWRQLNVIGAEGAWRGRIRHHEEFGEFVKLRIATTSPQPLPDPEAPLTFSAYDFLRALVERANEWLVTEEEAKAHFREEWQQKGLPAWGPLTLSPKGVLAAPRQHQEWLVWGPPGTGKTRDAVTRARQHVDQGGRVLMLAVANVAVDRFARAWDDEDSAQGVSLEDRQIFRFGASQSVILQENGQYRHMYEPTAEMQTLALAISVLTEALRELRYALRKYGESDEVLNQIRAKRQELLEADSEYNALALKLAGTSPAVATTLYRYMSTDTLSQRPDTLILVDEASMARMADVALLFASKISRRDTPDFVFYGDFQQLPPVSHSAHVPPDWGPRVDHWFGTSIFDAVGCDSPKVVQTLTDRGDLRTLDLQFRMAPDLAQLISDVFYRGRLGDGALRERVAFPGFPEEDLLWVDPRAVTVPNAFDAEPGMWHGSSHWPRSAWVAQQLAQLARWSRVGTSVMIVTPYRAQRILLAADQRLADIGVQVGTVHALQGQEADIVIIDLVNPTSRFCATGHQSRHLANVALSRAKAKAILLADARAWDSPWYREFCLRATPWVPDFSAAQSTSAGGKVRNLNEIPR